MNNEKNTDNNKYNIVMQKVCKNVNSIGKYKFSSRLFFLFYTYT